MSTRDQIYQLPLGNIGDFSFDDAVANVFPDMIQRSVPGYGSIVRMLALLSEQCVVEGTHCYDLGCSLGACALAIASGIDASDIDSSSVKLFAVDNSQAMIERLEQRLNSVDGDENNASKNLFTQIKSTAQIEALCSDIRDVKIENASLVVMNFTLQFIPKEARQALLNKIYEGLVPGGVLVLSEKIRMAHDDMNERFIDLHHHFKRANGYSHLEISQKRNALENVLIADTLETHQQRLRAAGFEHYETWFQCFNFLSMLAVKADHESA